MSTYGGPAKVSKTKPVRRMFSPADKASLDLDRPAGEQGLGVYCPSDYTLPPRAATDVHFQSSRRGGSGYHGRSTSGVSQMSTATTGSGQRTGSFVHPFQQTPRPYTPPQAASYQGSLLGSEYSREPPAFTEEEDQRFAVRSHSTLSNHPNAMTPRSSFSNATPLRLSTKVNSSSRLVHGTSYSNLNSSISLSDQLSNPIDTTSPTSAGIRSSMEKGFRIRSRSDVVDPRQHKETIHEARRKFEEKEQAKAAKIAREEFKAMEKQNMKEARRAERGARRSTTSSRAQSERSRSDLTSTQEKADQLFGRDYSMAAVQAPPDIGEYVEAPRRRKTGASTTKKKTHGAWMTFMMWLRTRFLRMGQASH